MKKLNKKAKENNLKQELEWPDKTYFFFFVFFLFIRHHVDKEKERGRKKTLSNELIQRNMAWKLHDIYDYKVFYIVF